MNNLMIRFSGADLSRLRALVAAVEKEIALVPGAVTTPEAPASRTPLALSWSRLVEMLDLGAEPEMVACPSCHHLCTRGATRCGHCWNSLPTPQAAKQLAA